MRMNAGWKGLRRVGLLLATAAALSILVAACGGDDDDDGGGSDDVSAEAPKCGVGNGQKASGAPIKFGAINTKQPGTDFSEGGRAVQAYFDCVNDNGGINGRPVELIIETEQTDPGQVANAATKLAQDD